MVNEIPEAVRRLIAEKIHSVPELEAILLLSAYRECAWTSEQASERLFVSSTAAQQVLSELKARGFLAGHGDTYWFSPESPELASVISELAQLYRAHLVLITRLVHEKRATPQAG